MLATLLATGFCSARSSATASFGSGTAWPGARAILRRGVSRGTSTEAELRRIEAIQRRRAELLTPECVSAGRYETMFRSELSQACAHVTVAECTFRTDEFGEALVSERTTSPISVPRDNKFDRIAGAAICAARQSRSVTRQTLADRIGATDLQVQLYERGETRISLARYVAIARALGVDPSELLTKITGVPEVVRFPE